jgi:hypothetical protein
MAISLAIFVIVAIAWGLSYSSPWNTTVTLFDRLGPNGGLIGEGWEWRIASLQGVLDVAPRYSFYEWKTPFGTLALLSLLCALWHSLPWQLLTVRQRRMSRGQCNFCGYDVRASPERCPECGNIFEKRPQIST